MCFPDQKSVDERPSRSVNKRRKVSFAPAILVHETDTSSETWYQAVDYSTFERERRETIVALSTEDRCRPRGLEGTRQEIMDRKRKSLQCKKAVLEQQELQKSLGYFNPELLEETYRKFSDEAAHCARQRAMSLEQESSSPC
ncbi:hypothetical protein FisN_29Lh128 [Fistulifera solaris]|uniref:Uncharacterized protein n=1 Tax=Fistulifera solaris TaxID=1519565 RepID=A0A1Z5JLL4_FISSO|nr:hypothetical protein FisN_29Lh128 [Fistulifera solaris]|eukprot:GAX14907.1 hypothetical protein FisN_29Lh128 [Fistulifera solaris]